MTPDYSIQEFARLISRHPETLRRLARVGKLPGAYRIGRRWLIARETMDKHRGVSTQKTALVTA